MTFIQHDSFTWPEGRACAVSLTYDDGLPSHFNQVGPALEAQGFRGTFYTTIRSSIMDQPEQWRELAGRGHELGNHSIFHPCKPTPDRTWLEDWRDLSQYTPSRWRQELEVASLVLKLIDGQTERSYGNNCCHTTVGPDETPMDEILNDLFVAARGPYIKEIADPKAGINLMQVGHFGADSRQVEELQAEVEQAAAMGGWIVYMIHGVGDKEHRLHIKEAEHEKLIEWLGANLDRFWVAPFVDVAKYLRNYKPN